MAGIEGQYYLAYYSFNRPSYRDIKLPEDGQFTIELIDTWEMTIHMLPGLHNGRTRVDLPSKPYMALRIRRVRD